MDMGRWQLGDELPVAVQCTDAAGDPVAPNSAPTVTIYDSADARVLTALPIPRKDKQLGLFKHFVRIGADYSTGTYSVLFKWTAIAFNGAQEGWFEVVGGGDAVGAVTALYFYSAPHADFLVQQLDTGQIRAGKNPRL